MKTVLIIGYVWPEPSSTAAGSRMMQLIDFFISQEWKVIFASPASRSNFAFDLESISVEAVSIELNNDNFDQFASNLDPKLVLFDRFMMEEQFGWRVAKYCPNALRVLDTEDLHFLRKAREKQLNKNQELTFVELATDDAKREIASILRCDLSLIISSFEMQLLITQFKIDAALLLHLPFMLSGISDGVVAGFNPFSERLNFVTIGNFMHPPNVDSVRYLKNTVWPLIQLKLPKAQMHVYGAYPTEKITQFNAPKQRFYIKGRAENVNEVMRNARLCLAPIRFGAGIKGKFVDAMKNGTPVVTTAIGAEGMHDNLDWCGAVENEPQKIADAAVTLYSNEEVFLNAQKNGVAIINTLYIIKTLSDILAKTLSATMRNLETHRLQNFTGAMLMHHSMKSTMYMSKWIAEKNKD